MKRQNASWLLVLVVALLTLVAACAETTTAERSDGVRVSATNAPTPAAIALKEDMRELWTDHVVWTRDYIVATLGDRPEALSVTDRLMKNQEELGKAIGEYYGADAGNQITTLLKAHITGAVRVIDAAKADDKPALKVASENWSANAIEIADFLSKANPNWSRPALVDLMKDHLSTTSDEVTSRLKKDWAADIKAFDKVYDHAMMMSDALSDGIMKQFPERFSAAPAAK